MAFRVHSCRVDHLVHAQGAPGLSGSDPAEEEIRVLTKDILFGMNLLTLVGFLVMGLSLTLHRTGNAGVPLSIGLMCAGTALVFFGFFAVSSSD